MRFKCYTCKHVFEASEDEYVICPNCKSDNVAPEKRTSLRILLWVLGIVVVALLTCVMLFFIFPQKEEEKDLNTISDTNEETIVMPAEQKPVQEEKKVIEEKVIQPLTVKISELQYKQNAYSFEVKCENVPNDAKLIFILSGSFDGKVVATSNDGTFSKIVPSKEEGGTYKLVIKDTLSGYVLHEQIIAGFVQQNIKVNKLARETLENLINTKSSSLMGANAQIAPKVKLIFDNLDSDEKKPVIFADIFNKITMGDWESVKVISVKYNTNNLITEVHIFIKHVEF